jgi:hypothetical protein
MYTTPRTTHIFASWDSPISHTSYLKLMNVLYEGDAPYVCNVLFS